MKTVTTLMMLFGFTSIASAQMDRFDPITGSGTTDRDIRYSYHLARQLARCKYDVVEEATRSEDPRIRAAASLSLSVYGELYVFELIKTLETAGSTLERQAARQSLIWISAKKLGRGKGQRDFGPPPDATPQESQASAKLWKAWYSE